MDNLQISDWLRSAETNRKNPKLKKVRQKGKNLIWRIFWKYLTFSDGSGTRNRILGGRNQPKSGFKGQVEQDFS